MLLDVIQGIETGGILIIQDTIHYSGRRILRSYINAAIRRGEVIHVVGFETSEERLCAGLDSGCVQQLHFHDGYSDPLGWTTHSPFTVRQFTTPELIQVLKQTPQAKGATLVIDSLSWILRHHDPVVICQQLQELKRGGAVRTIVGLLHTDLHPQAVVGSVCHLATVVISVAAGSSGESAVAKTTRRSKSGKVMQEEELFNVMEDLSVTVQAKRSHHEATQMDTVEHGDPTANLTFNLRLSEVEREAKEKVALPFVFSQEKKSALLKPRKGAGQILYEPDANDDFDQEDPDDDLDV